MDHQPVLGDALGIAGAFASVHEDVVPTADFRRNAQCAQGTGHRLHIGRIVGLQVADASCDGVVEILQVVIHGSAARHAPGQDNALFPQVGEIDLGVRALVQANNDGRPVLPQVENRLVRLELFQAELVERHVEVRVRRAVLEVFH